MNMKVSIAVLVLVVLVANDQVEESTAATCIATELAPCFPAIAFGAAPSSACCSKLRVQRPCLCQYRNDPNLRNYVNSPNARRVLISCGIPVPNC
ncbi:hypothetical protein Sjap_014904 [Stephania japonica]|uniref:Bifunctional inhibitor/plant lipid transfer protein/seed storage helical domain-containing protein n=1 Tax=Stephania japonica TaxID=461633 RepID=A0AAP0NQD3_9MAGN